MLNPVAFCDLSRQVQVLLKLSPWKYRGRSVTSLDNSCEHVMVITCHLQSFHLLTMLSAKLATWPPNNPSVEIPLIVVDYEKGPILLR